MSILRNPHVAVSTSRVEGHHIPHHNNPVKSLNRAALFFTLTAAPSSRRFWADCKRGPGRKQGQLVSDPGHGHQCVHAGGCPSPQPNYCTTRRQPAGDTTTKMAVEREMSSATVSVL